MFQTAEGCRLLHIQDEHKIKFSGKTINHTSFHTSFAPVNPYLNDVDSDCLSITLTVELEKASHCDLKVSNTTEKYVAFKVNYLKFFCFLCLSLSYSHFLFKCNSKNLVHFAFTCIIFSPFFVVC